MSRNTDRRVHAEDDSIEVVRYDRAGKWYVESKRPLIPCRAVSLDKAVHIAVDCVANGGKVHLGLSGGRAFDAKMRDRRAT
jgi:hypothetical protein